MEDEKLDIKIRAKLEQAVSEFNKLTRSAMGFNNVITTTIQKVDTFGNKSFTNIIKSLDGTAQYTEKLDSKLEKISETFKSTEKPANNFGKIMKSAFDVNRLYLYWNLTKRVRDGLGKMITSAIDYLEAQNKFEASIGRSAAPQATRFVNQMTEAIGIAKTELMDYMSTYKNILSGLGNFTDVQSEKISESLTKMALDYSSLFNVGTSEAMNKFQSALTGSIRPIRSDSGFDVSDTTIGAKAKELGLERSVGQLNQMEKRLLRIIVLMEQMKRTGAMNDLANTIEQPANQLKVLKAQLQEVGMWLGAVFTNTLGKILPYVNAFVMTIKELIKMFAIFVGFGSDRVSGFKDVIEVAEDGVGGISSGLGSAAKKAKELKKTLMGFDVLNVITTPKDSDAGGGVGSIDPKILGALEEYGSLMENVRMKATDIRDRIMEWLGFTKIINPETGEINWALKEGYTNIEKIRDIISVIVGLGIVTKIYNIVKGIREALGITTTLKDVIKGIGFSGISAAFLKVITVAIGAGTAIWGVFNTIKGIAEIIKGETLVGVMDVIAGIAGVVAGVAVLFGAWPVALGAAIVGAVALITRTIADNWEEIKKFFGDIWTNFNEKVVKPIKEFVSTIATFVWEHSIGPITKYITDIGVKFGEVARKIVEKVIEINLKMLEILVALGNAAYQYIIKPIMDFFGKLASYAWNNAIKPMMNYFIDLWNKVNQKFIQPLLNAFRTIGTKIAEFIDGSIRGVVNAVFGRIEERINGFINLLNGAIEMINKIPNVNISAVSPISLPRMADGGMPNVGQMFIAREAGPELVGKIGNNNAVMNNNQIVQSVSQGVAAAVSSVLGNGLGNGDIRLIVDGRELTTVVQHRTLRTTNIFGTA